MNRSPAESNANPAGAFNNPAAAGPPSPPNPEDVDPTNTPAAVTVYADELTAVVSAAVDTAIVCVVEASGGLTTLDTVTVSASPAAMLWGTVNVVFAFEFASV